MMQARAVQFPAPSAAPSALPPAPNVVTPKVLTARDVAALQSRGQELSNQLRSATGRRTSVQQSLRNATGADRAGLEQRLGVLDARIARLESDIDENGSQLASLSASRVATTESPFGSFNSPRSRLVDNLVPIVIIFTLFVLTPIAASIARILWRRGSMPRQAPQSADQTRRLERMEQAIDSIAIEMERVSEGQRFVTRLMTDRQNVVGAGQEPAQPIAVAMGEKIAEPR